MKNIKKIALIESIANVLSGLLLSIFVIQPVAFKIFNIHTSLSQNIGLAVFFTIISIIRGYIWRLFFHNKFYKI